MTRSIQIHVKYCDEIIRHADDFRYTVVGAYTGIYPVSEFPVLVPKICFNIEIFIPADYEDFYAKPLKVEVTKDDEPVSNIEMQPVEKDTVPFFGSGEEPQILVCNLHHTVNWFPLDQECKLRVRLSIDGHIIAQSEPLKVIQLANDQKPVN